MLGEEGWGGVEAKIDCSCRFKSYICFLFKKNIMSEGKPEGLGKKRDTSRNSIFFIVLCRQLRGLSMLVSAGLLKFFFFGGGGVQGQGAW